MTAEHTLLDHLARCQAAELIRQVQADPDLEYWFKHALVQEAAYESLLKSARAELHGRVAESIERTAGNGPDTDAAVLAMHFEAAGMDARALPYAVAAADRARRTYAHQEALAFYDRSLAMTDRLKDPSLTTQVRMIYVHRGRVLEVMGDHLAAEANYRAMLAAAERAGDTAMQADALNHLATEQAVHGGQNPDLPRNLEAALRQAERSGEPILAGQALWNMGIYHRFRDPPASIEFLERALALAQAAPADLASRELAAAVWNDLGIACLTSGQFRRALAAREQAAAAYRELDVRPMLADAMSGSAMLYHFMGDPDRARSLSFEAMAISKAIDNPWGEVYSGWSLQEIEIDTGAFEATLANADQRTAAARQVGFPVFIGLVLSEVARAHRELGLVRRSQPLAAEAASHFAAMDMPSWTAWSRAVAGADALARGDLAAAQAAIEPLWREHDDSIQMFHGYLVPGPVYAEWALAAGHPGLGLGLCDWMLGRLEPEEAWRITGEMRYWRGRIYMAVGDLSRAEADLLEAHSRLTHAGVVILTWKIDAALAELYHERGDRAAEAAALENARRGIARLADGIRDETLRRSFLDRTDVQKVLAT
jgi:tetratricopeptide (TPR) repeat protein